MKVLVGLVGTDGSLMPGGWASTVKWIPNSLVNSTMAENLDLSFGLIRDVPHDLQAT
jgi:hypothetical protein